MSDSGITDATIPGLLIPAPTDIPDSEEIVPTNTCTRPADTDGNTSITNTPGVNARGGTLSPRAFETLIENITQQPSEGTERHSDVHSRGGTSVPRYSRGGGNRHFYPTRHYDFDQQEDHDTRVPRYSARFGKVPQETSHTYETCRNIETL